MIGILKEPPRHRSLVPSDILDEARSWCAEAEDSGSDVYLAFSGSPDMRCAGILVTHKSDPDALIVHCPLQPGLEPHSAVWRADLYRQLRVALRIAASPSTARTAVDAIWLGWISEGGHPVPHWIYGLSCMPLKDGWDGNFVRPMPFCPAVFEHMASQPQAVQWIKRNQGASPTNTRA
jgi:hypothetical protein